MTNPFFEDWTAPFGAPPLDRIRPEHFAPAYDRALAEHRAEIGTIAENREPPSFDNVVLALEKSSKLLTRIDGVFGNLTSAATNEALQAIELEMAPRLSAHWSAVLMHPVLFARLDALYQKRASLSLDAESLRVLERYRLDFVRAGAQLNSEGRERLTAIGQRLAVLGTQFHQNVLGEEEDWTLSLTEAQIAGVPQGVRDAAAATATSLKLDAPYAVTLSRSSAEPFLQFADDRGLREQLWRAWTARGGNDNVRSNTAIITEMLTLRGERAALLGYENFAAFKLADSMAGTAQKARALLEEVWEPARKRALEERDALQGLIARQGLNFRLAPWDWRYYAEKLRQEKYDFDAEQLQPYFQLSNLIEAAFFTAQKLFGLSFHERRDIPVYHPDVRVWEVRRENAVIGLFYGDYFARAGKQSGAWMSSFRDQQTLDGDVLPIITNNANFSKSDPCLLSFDDAMTLFHEMGHALHGLLSKVRFPRLSGTNVARDFVELPSQLFEHWLKEPAVLERFARHHQTGEPIPKALLQKLLAARNYGQGFATVEFLASALIDMDFHTVDWTQSTPGGDPIRTQAETLTRIGMPEEIVPRHSAPHFTHVFGGDGYAAGYYAYLWSEVLDADGFKAFEETKDPFDPATAQRLYQFIYSAGGTRDFAAAYRAFRGRDPHVEALLEGRGLLAPAA